MTPNAVTTSSGPSRRGFLASTAVATAAVAGGMPLLAACGGSDTGSRAGEQVQSDSEFLIEGMDYFGADGGNPPLYAGQPAGIWSVIRKGASKGDRGERAGRRRRRGRALRHR
ncbi:hypothetical protein [Streptomyces bluensis]|uniref:Twin-arginine translocation signal domain-containing protein n=1 Tax=Streptomyces bluensis TaxID=33897 RepID=A0ABW6UBL9_9ACTN